MHSNLPQLDSIIERKNIQDQPLDPKATVFLPNMSHPANSITCNQNESDILGDITRFFVKERFIIV